MGRFFRLVAVIAVGSLLGLVTPPAAGAGASDDAVKISITAEGLEGLPEQPKPGWWTFEITNETTAEAELNVTLLNKGFTVDDLETLAGASPAEINDALAFLGGAVLEVGATTTTTIRLSKGTVVFAGYLAETDAEFNEPVQVKGKRTNTKAPKADVKVDGIDHAFEMAEQVPTDAVWEFRNKGEQWHVLGVCRLVEGKTFDDALAYAETIDPATGIGVGEDPCPEVPGGIATISAGVKSSTPQTFDPGEYVAFCYLPDVETGEPHFLLGMAEPFTVG